MKAYKIALLALVVLLLAACGPTPTGTFHVPGSTLTPVPTPTWNMKPGTPTPLPQPAFPVTVSDDAGRTVTIARPPQRLISLAPSNTETLFALGLGSKVVAVGSSFDDYPPEAKVLPKVAEPDVTRPNLEKIVALAPDLILMTGGDPLPIELINRLEGLQLTVLVLYPRDIESILQDIELIGTATGASKEAKTLTTNLRGRLDAVIAKVKTATTKPKVFYEVDATNPARPFTAGPGSFIDAMLTLVGASNVAAGAKSPWAEFSAEELVRQDPEIIILGDANYGVTVDSVKARPGWSTLTAVKKGAIYPIDDNLVSRPGPRLVDGLEALARIVHPELFR